MSRFVEREKSDRVRTLRKAGDGYRQRSANEWSVDKEALDNRDAENNQLRRQRHADTKAELSEEIVEFLGLSESQASSVKIFDERDGMFLLHFTSEEPEKGLENLRGLVLQQTDSKDWSLPDYVQVCRSFPHTKDYEAGKPENLSKVTGKILEAHWSEEGTVIRVFFANGRWYISSHRLIDCTNRRWSSKRNFGDLFDDCIPRDQLHNYLDRDLVYVFLLQHPENRIVTNFEAPSLLHVLTLKKTEEGLEETEAKVDHPNVHYPVKLETNDVSELLALAENPPDQKNGVILKVKNGEEDGYVKFVSQEYTRKRLIRGNEPNLSIRYLDLTRLEDNGPAAELLEMFSENKPALLNQRQDVRNLKSYLNDIYRSRFVHKERHVVPRDEYLVVKHTYDAVYKQVDGAFSQYSFSDLAERTNREIERQICISNSAKLLRMIKNMNELLEGN